MNPGISAVVRGLWDAGLAHRDIKPANLLVQNRHVRLIDTFLTEVHATPWRQALDLANMMLVLALFSDPGRVYQRARQLFTDSDIAEAFAARQGGAMPGQLRQLLRARAGDLHAEFVRLLPSPPQPFRIQRWSLRRVGLWALVAALLTLFGSVIASGFTNNEAGSTPLNNTSLGCTDLEALWLEAQAVPSASLVPCVRSLPAGWTLAGVTVNDGRSVLTFDHDRAGAAALVVRLTAACDPAGAEERPAAEPTVQRFERLERDRDESDATWYDRFPGGCVTTRLTASARHRAQLANEASLVLGFTARQELRQVLERRSGGRLHLDP
jgi:hypothetical protein